jgi:hypothetical protein
VTTPDGGTLPPRPASSPDVDLFGSTTSGRSRRRSWRIELEGLGPSACRSEEVRVTMVDAETGKRSAVRVPFSWLVDVAVSGSKCAVSIEEGTYS